ncbi:MAG TPA: DUF6089 family protein [Cytophagaceae bacterium]
MKTNRLFIPFLIGVLSLCSSLLLAQPGTGTREYSGFFDSYYYRGPLSFTLGGGITAYKGDLGKGLEASKIQPIFGLGANYKLWPRMMFGAEISFGKLAGDKDFDSTRNLAFETKLTQLDLYTRFYLVDDITRIARDRRKHPKLVKPYITTGLTFLRYKVDSYYTTPPTVDQERETAKNPGVSIAVPVGLGASFFITHRVSITTDIAYRITFTDFLDGISERGNPDKKDGYGVFSVKLQYSPTAPKKKKKKKLSPPDPNEGGGQSDPDFLKKHPQHQKREQPTKNYGNYDYGDEEDMDDQQDDGSWDEEYQEENQGQPNNQKQQEEDSWEDDGW